jgi:hypothetical protein
MVLILDSEYLTLDLVELYSPTKLIQIIYILMGSGLVLKSV